MPKSSRPRAIGGHEDVRGLDVTVDHQVAVGVVHRAGRLEKDLETLADRQPPLVAHRSMGSALHVLHGNVRPAVLGDARVEEPRDVGVPGQGQDLPLYVEALHHVPAVESGLQQFERHQLLEILVGAFGEIDHRHAAATELAKDPIAADALAVHGLFCLEFALEARPDGADHGPAGQQSGLLLLAPHQKSFHEVLQLEVITAARGDQRSALAGRDIQDLVEDPVRPVPAGFRGRHLPNRPALPVSHARARIQSRWTVRSETSRAYRGLLLRVAGEEAALHHPSHPLELRAANRSRA